MRLTPPSIHRWRERLWLSFVAFRTKVQRHGITAWRINKPARRVAITWLSSLGLLVLICVLQFRALRPYYMQAIGQPGGTYSEGIVGSITTINPVLADGGANADAARLVFSGLTRYRHDGKLEGDLAKSWTMSPDGRVYTFALRPNIRWHDGQPLTARDVAFTIGLIQNPDTRSPYAAAWQGVEVTTPNDQTVVMTLPVRYDAFINSTTVGIVPQHILQEVPAINLRVDSFNQAPIGTGPFKVVNFDTDNGSVTLNAFEAFYRGRPQLDGLVLRVYNNQSALQAAYRKHQVTGMARSANSTANRYGASSLHSLAIPEEVALFMRTPSTILNDPGVRKALNMAINRQQLIDQVLAGRAQALSVPALSSQLPTGATYPIPNQDIQTAKQLLDTAGWRLTGGSVRTKNGKELSLSLVTAQTDDYKAVASRIVKQLSAVGVKVQVEAVDVTTLQRSYITPRNYDLLLYGLNAGVDLDPYPYWHSSQVKAPGLNVSQYSSKTADKALESARATTDNRVRDVRLKSFLDTWSVDVPAVMLYTPKYLYVTQDKVRGPLDGQLVTPADRFYGVETWTVRSKLVRR